MKTITASERSTLIRLASSLPKGDETRKAILNGLRLAKRKSVDDKGNVNSGKPAVGWSAKENPNYKKHKNTRCYDKSKTPGENPGEGGCYKRIHNYGEANSGEPGSTARKKYNEAWLANGDTTMKRTISPDGHGGTFNPQTGEQISRSPKYKRPKRKKKK